MDDPPRPNLRLVDGATGELADVCPYCLDAEQAMRNLRRQNTELKNKLNVALGLEPDAEQIMEVLEFWRSRIMPRAKIVVGSERWLKVRARLRERDAKTKEAAYSVLHLKAAVTGALLSKDHVENNWLDAATIFRDSVTTDKHIARTVRFKRVYGTSALGLVDELAGEGLRWLAERCACGHLWVEHLRGGPRPDGSQPCSECDCAHYDFFSAKVDRFLREQGE